MRILHVNNINEVASIYAKEQRRRGHDVTIYEPSLKGGLAPLPIKLALMTERIFDLRHIIGSLNPDHFDIVHIHWASYGVLGLVSRTPFIVHCHGNDVRHRLHQPLLRQGLSLLLQRASAVLCVTPDLLPVVRQVRHDAIFSPGPVDTMQFAPDKNKSQRRPDAWTILLFARLDPEKGTETAIQGIIRFADRHPGINVKLLNYGSLKEQYQRDYGKRFEFIPPLEPHEVPHVLQEADVVVGQFLAGALGLSELQAMSCAKPVIASFLYDEAYPTPPPLCKATSPEEVDHHLEMLFQQPEEAITLGNKAREWVIEHHDEKALVSQLETLYESMVRCTPDHTHFFQNLDVDSFQPAVHSKRDEEKERR